MPGKTLHRTLPPPAEIDSLLGAVVSTLQRGFGSRLVSVILFGSVARGDFDTQTSDVDLLLVVEGISRSEARRYDTFREAIGSLDGLLERLARQGCDVQFSPVLKTPAEAACHTPLYLDMVHDARILLDRDGFFEGVLRGLRARLDELGARRVMLEDGAWYWDLKPDYRFGDVVEI